MPPILFVLADLRWNDEVIVLVVFLFFYQINTTIKDITLRTIFYAVGTHMRMSNVVNVVVNTLEHAHLICLHPAQCFLIMASRF